MAATLHAFGLIGAFLGTLACCALGWKERPPAGRVIRSLLAGLALAFLAPFLFAHLCRRGYPGAQVILWIVCLVGVLACVTRTRASLVAAGLLSMVMYLLCSQFLALSHREDLSGGSPVLENRPLVYARDRALKVLRDRRPDESEARGPGWLLNSDLCTPELKECLTHEVPARVEHSKLWHTFFTGLRARRTVPVALWFPGGRLPEAADGLEWRNAPSN